MTKTYTNLGYLGYGFQKKLVSQIVLDKKFGNAIMQVFKPKYIEDKFLKLLSAKLKDFHEKYDNIPTFQTLEEIVLDEVKREVDRNQLIQLINEIKEIDSVDFAHVQTKSENFCKQQELKNAAMKIKRIVDAGNVDRYDECEEILKDALRITDIHEDDCDVFDGIDDVLSDDFREPIPLGLGTKLNADLNGGLAKGELMIILAPTGVGKTTAATRIANTAYNLGKVVVQIFFEDSTKNIKRKHYACWSGIEINHLSTRRDEVRATISEFEDTGGRLILKKFPSHGTTIPKIRQYLYKLKSNGINPDMVVLDYIDCVSAMRQYDNDYAGEGETMRQFETMISESDLNVAGVTFVQGNRSSISASVVETDQMGGSIKKAQIGHVIISVARTLDQKEDKLATMALLKSRVGDDGIVYEDILFDNARVYIDTSRSDTMSMKSFGTKKEKDGKDRIRDIVGKAQNKYRKTGGTSTHHTK